MADKRIEPRKERGDAVETTDTAAPVSSDLFGGTKRPYLIVIAGAQVGELHKIVKARTTIGRAQSADIRIVDDGISRHHVEVLLEGERVFVRDLNSTNGTFRNGERVELQAEVADGDKVSVGSTTILKFTFKDGIDEAYESQLYRSATRDGLTHALKREFFLERLESEVAFAVRHSVPLSLIMWDLDRFKAVNDQHGHPAGDLVLTATARAVQETIRREDLFGRYGGEEFALSCRGTPQDVASRMAERLRRAVEETVVDNNQLILHVTASFGVAACPSVGIANPTELIAAADAAMYRAKAEGRNRVVSAPTTRA
jgi:diguanylate cyclase (GGDEF)-like protein